MTSTSHDLVGILLSVSLLLITMASIQSGTPLAESMFSLVGAQGTTALWLFFVALILLLLLCPRRKRLSLQSLRSVVAYGIALGGMSLLFYLSVHIVSLGIAVVLKLTGSLLVATPSSRRLPDFLWIGLAVFGIRLLLPLGNSVEPLNLVGAAYALDAGVCWALYILFGQRAGADHGAQSAAPGVLVAAILVVPIDVAHAGADLLDSVSIPLALGVVVLSMALPHILEMVALTRLPVRVLDILMGIEPVFGTLSGLPFLGERLNPTQWLTTGAIILVSVGTTPSVKSRGVAPALPVRG